MGGLRYGKEVVVEGDGYIGGVRWVVGVGWWWEVYWVVCGGLLLLGGGLGV